MDHSQDQVAVIIATFNRRERLHTAIESVEKQTHPQFEVFVSDDGSSDGTQEMVERWPNSRVHLVSGPHGGHPSITRNRALEIVKCEGRFDWVAILDDDDEWLPTKLERQLELAHLMNVRAVCCNAAVRDINGNILSSAMHSNPLARIRLEDMAIGNRLICSAVMFSAELLDYVEKFPDSSHLKAVEDYALWLRIAALTDWAYLDESLTVYLDAPQQSIRRHESGDHAQIVRTVSRDFEVWFKNLENDSSNQQWLLAAIARRRRWRSQRRKLQLEKLLRAFKKLRRMLLNRL